MCAIILPANDTQEVIVEGYLTAKEVAALIGVDPSAIRKRAAAGKSIKGAIKVGDKYRGEWYIPVAEAEQLRRSAAGKPPKRQKP